jgi:hypothetical protein
MTDDDLDIVAEAMAELALVRGTKASAKITEGFGVLLAYLVKLEARVAEIETRGIAWKGVWQPALQYKPGDLVTYDGSIFHANADTRAKPGNGSTDWTLAVKRGADGKDADTRKRIPTGTRR